jgi:hypothetical protein
MAEKMERPDHPTLEPHFRVSRIASIHAISTTAASTVRRQQLPIGDFLNGHLQYSRLQNRLHPHTLFQICLPLL